MTPAMRLDRAAALAVGSVVSVAQDLDFLDPQLLRRGLEARLAGAAGRVRIAGTLDRRLAFIERQDGRWAVADLAGTPHRDRAWPQWASGHAQGDDPRAWLPPATLDEHAVYRLSLPDGHLVALHHREHIAAARL